MNVQQRFIVPGCIVVSLTVLAASDASTIHSSGEICVFEVSDANISPSGVPSPRLSSSTNLASPTAPWESLLPLACLVGFIP